MKKIASELKGNNRKLYKLKSHFILVAKLQNHQSYTILAESDHTPLVFGIELPFYLNKIYVMK